MSNATRDSILSLLKSGAHAAIYVWKPQMIDSLMSNAGELIQPQYETLPVKVLNYGLFIGWCYAVEYEGEVLCGPMRAHGPEAIRIAIDRRFEEIERELFNLGYAPKGDELRAWAEEGIRYGHSAAESARMMILYGGAVKVPVKECA